MSAPDLVNGCFELFGGIAVAMSVKKLWRDRSLRGYSLATILFFFSWGAWNLYYYPHLNQWASFVGGFGVFSANAVYVGSLAWLWWKERGL